MARLLNTLSTSEVKRNSLAVKDRSSVLAAASHWSLAVLPTSELQGHSSPVSGTALTLLLRLQRGHGVPTKCSLPRPATPTLTTQTAASPHSEFQGDQCPNSRLRSCAVTSCSSLLRLPFGHSANIRWAPGAGQALKQAPGMWRRLRLLPPDGDPHFPPTPKDAISFCLQVI